MENIKIKIPNPEISEKVQKKAFSLGYRWSIEEDSVSYIDRPFLYLRNYSIILYGIYLNIFESDSANEITWEDFLYKDVDINNCKINLFNINEPSEYNNLSAKLISLGIQSYGNNPLLPPFDCNFEGIYIKDGKTTVVGTKLYYNSISLPELSVDYILENYKEKEMEVLPEKWCIKVTTENKSFLQDLFNYEIGFSKNYDYYIGGYYGPDKDNTGHKGSQNLKDRTEITFDQFKRLVLKQKAQDNKNMNEITLKCIKTPSKAKNIKEGDNYSGIYIDEEETQVDTYEEAVYFLCQNDRGVQARYNIDLFEKPEVIKKTISLVGLLSYLHFTGSSIKFVDGAYTHDICNDNGNLLKVTQSPNSCGIYLIGGQTTQGVDELCDLIFENIEDAYSELSKIYNLDFYYDDFGNFIFKNYVEYKLSIINAAFKIISTNEDSYAVGLLDSMDCIKTDYFVNPNSHNNIKMWIFTNAGPIKEEDED